MTDTPDPAGFDDEGPEAAPGGEVLEAIVAGGAAGRLDRALADALPQISRARLRALMEAGAVTRDGAAVTDPSGRAAAGAYRIAVPAPVAATPEPQDIPLEVLFEDPHLIVVNKSAGMAVHPGPGVPDGTLVNALLHHCGASLSGIGGVARPGIVHRLDKETSGVMVAAKTDAAHQGLAALFAAHDIERSYIALVRGAPRPPAGEIRTRIGRSTHDRMKMAVLKTGGREAVTHYRTERTFGPAGGPLAARLACRLETGRTHQIRVHMASLGSPCLGDPVYGSGAPAAAVREALRESGLARQALHAAVLGFVHPVTGERLRFESTPPPDMAALEARLSDL
jgi:23S rRNA pseudouridine1911/1915/1917 synthase